jgi:predicted  nucleic acid-binding Zn-ribbon protein
MIDKTYMELEADNKFINEQARRLFEQCVDLRDKLAAREAELAGMTKARDTFYADMLLYKKACNVLIKFRETLFGAIKKRDGQIKNLKDCIDDDRFDFNVAQEAKDARIAELEEALSKAKETALSCVTKIRHGLGAGGHSTGMYVEVELGGAICDAITDALTEEFEMQALSEKESK